MWGKCEILSGIIRWIFFSLSHLFDNKWKKRTADGQDKIPFFLLACAHCLLFYNAGTCEKERIPFQKRKKKSDRPHISFFSFLVWPFDRSFFLLKRNHLPTIRMKTYDRSRSFSFSREIFLVSISWLGQRPLLRASQRTQESQHNKRKRRKQTFDRISDRLFSFFF